MISTYPRTRSPSHEDDILQAPPRCGHVDDAHGNVASVTTGTATNITTYDEAGYVASTISATGITKIFTHDANGNDTGHGHDDDGPVV